MNKAFHLQIEQSGIASLRFTGNESQNLDYEILKELSNIVEHLSVNALVKLLVIKSSHPEIFCSGFDYQILESLKSQGQLKSFIENAQNTLLKLYALPFPVIAFIDGIAQAEGFELALFCHYRFGTERARFSLPQVSLGLSPFLGASQRLPHLIGIRKSFPILLSQSSLNAEEAKSVSLLDDFCMLHESENELKKFLKKAMSSRGHMALQKKHKGFHRYFLEDNPITRPWLFYHAEINYKGPAKPSVEKSLELVHEGFSLSLEDGLKRELDIFLCLEEQNLSKNLRRLHKTEKEQKQKLEPYPIKQAAIFGAGNKGGDLAFMLKEAFIPTRIAASSWELISQSYQRACVEKNQSIEKISATTSWEGFYEISCLFETSEDEIEKKKQTLKKAEKVVDNDCPLLCYCTSICSKELEDDLDNPSRLYLISLLNKEDPFIELLGEGNSYRERKSDKLKKVLGILQRINKIPLFVRDCPGALQHRIAFAFINEALLMLEEGIEAGRIENLSKNFGFRKGPLKYADQIGLKSVFRLGQKLKILKGKNYRVSRLLEVLSEREVFFFYHKKKALFDYKQYLLEKRQSLIDDKGIIDRLIFSVINESFYCLEEEILHKENANILDWALVEGFGFPKKHGGPIAYAEEFLLNNCANKLKQLSLEHGKRFDPCPLLLDKARHQESFF